jgi:hypothetical protein
MHANIAVLVISVLLLLGHEAILTALGTTNAHGLRDYMWFWYTIILFVSVALHHMVLLKNIHNILKAALGFICLVAVALVYPLIVCHLTNSAGNTAKEWLPHPGNSGMQLMSVNKDLFFSIWLPLLPYGVAALIISLLMVFYHQKVKTGDDLK